MDVDAACVMGSRALLPLGAPRGWHGSLVCPELRYSQEQTHLFSVLLGVSPVRAGTQTCPAPTEVGVCRGLGYH